MTNDSRMKYIAMFRKNNLTDYDVFFKCCEYGYGELAYDIIGPSMIDSPAEIGPGVSVEKMLITKIH